MWRSLPRSIVLFCPGLKEQNAFGANNSQSSARRKPLAREFPGRDDLPVTAWRIWIASVAMPVDPLISYFTGPRPPWCVDNIAEIVDGVTILKVVNHGDLIDEFAQIPVDCRDGH